MQDEERNLNQIENNEEEPHDNADTFEEFDEANDDKENEEMYFTEAYNLQDYYTFVGSNKEKVNDLPNTASDSQHSQLKENLCNFKDQLCKSDDKDGDFDANIDGQSKVILEKPEKTKKECSICLKSFNTNRNLTIHSRIHSNEKPFECIYCEKSFKQTHHLKQHERIHTNEKAFECKKCKKCFAHQSALKLHERLH